MIGLFLFSLLIDLLIFVFYYLSYTTKSYLITHHNWAEVAQAPWVAFSDPNPLHYQSLIFFWLLLIYFTLVWLCYVVFLLF